jgi:cytidine deaminase
MSKSASPLLPSGEGGGPKGVRKDARPSERAIGPPDEGAVPKTRARFAREPSPQPLSRRRGGPRVDGSTGAALQELFAAAKAAQANAYAPYSRFRVGAALRSASGAVFSGCNVENAAYPQGSCAEAGAIAAMALAGDRRIAEILVVGDGEALCTPCGGCRQRIREFADAKTWVYVAGPEGVRAAFSLAELLPESFGPDHLAV